MNAMILNPTTPIKSTNAPKTRKITRVERCCSSSRLSASRKTSFSSNSINAPNEASLS